MRQRFTSDRSGNFATLTALGFPVLLLMVGLTLDYSGFYLQQRELQSLADLGALTAASHFDRPAPAAQEFLSDNGLGSLRLIDPATGSSAIGADARTLRVELGRYTGDPAVPVDDRFIRDGTPTNAVRVSVQVPGKRYFLTREAPQGLAASAVASLAPEASFTIGSRLAGLHGGMANALLGSLLGSSVSLTVMDYQALVDADLSLLTFADALAANLNLTAATYRDVLDSRMTIGQILSATTRIPGLRPPLRGALQILATAAQSNTRTIPIGALMSLGSAETHRVGGALPGFASKVGLLELVSAAAWLANGERQVGVMVGAGLPGLTSATLEIAVGEPAQSTPRFVTGPAGSVVRTAQTRIKLDARIGTLLGVGVQLPIYGEIAWAEARLASVTCEGSDAATQRVGIEVLPGLSSLTVAEVTSAQLTNFRTSPALSPARILTAPLVNVTGSANASISNNRPEMLTFNAREISDRTVKQVSTRNPTETLTASLIRSLDLRVSVIGLGLGVPAGLRGTIAALAAAATPSIDFVLDSALATLGLRLGQADVWVAGASCGRPVLVQ